MAIKSPRKLVDKAFRELGGRVADRAESALYYVFPDGSHMVVHPRLSLGAAESLIATARRKFDPKRRPTIDGRRAKDKPTVNLGRLVASKHAQERLALMRSQAPVEWGEIVRTLQHPDRVLYSDHHSAWTWVGHRIAVCIGFPEDGAQVITTILWADDDLWAQNPRPHAG